MERLSDLPVKEDTNPTQEEMMVANKLFGGDPTPKKNMWKAVKVIAYTSILFIALSNPWIDNLIIKIPYMENPRSVFIAKIAVFITLFMAIYNFV